MYFQAFLPSRMDPFLLRPPTASPTPLSRDLFFFLSSVIIGTLSILLIFFFKKKKKNWTAREETEIPCVTAVQYSRLGNLGNSFWLRQWCGLRYILNPSTDICGCAAQVLGIHGFGLCEGSIYLISVPAAASEAMSQTVHSSAYM